MALGITTIEDLVGNYYEGYVDLSKAADPAKYATTGYVNTTFGPQAFSQINLLANTWGALPKIGRTQNGWRVETAVGVLTGGGVAESGNLPDSDKPDVTEVTAAPKEIVTRFDPSTKLLNNVGKNDSYGNDSVWRQRLEVRHAKQINGHLHTNVTTLASNNMESIDRVVSSYAEVTNCGDVDANDSDIYAIDRDAAAGWFDANVDHNSNTDRSLTLKLIRDAIKSSRNLGGTPNLILTSPETMSQIENLIDTQMRYSLDRKISKMGANGLQVQGIEAGAEVSVLFGLPIVVDSDVVDDGTGRIYVLDTTSQFGVPKLSIGVTAPTTYHENKNIAVTGKLEFVTALHTSAELLCTVFAHQSKIRDLSA